MAVRLPMLLDPNRLVVWAADLIRALEIALSDVERTKQTRGQIVQLPSYSKTALPPATPPGQMVYVSDEAGGAVPAFADGSQWRRVTDRGVVS